MSDREIDQAAEAIDEAKEAAREERESRPFDGGEVDQVDGP